MVEFDLFDELNISWKSLMVLQKEEASKLFESGTLLSYSMSLDPFRFWMVISADSESMLLETVHQLPLSEYLDFDYFRLNQHSSMDPIPVISLN